MHNDALRNLALASIWPGGVATGLQEDTPYYIDVSARLPCRLFVDDVELPRTPDGRFAWTPNFYAGRVSVAAVELSGQEHAFQVDVSPTSKKLGVEQFDIMVAEIRAFDTALLLGDSAATMEFGREGRLGGFESLVQLSRLRQHGPGFLTAVREILRANHRQLRASAEPVSIARIRRLHPNALQERRLAAVATGHLVDGDNLESIKLRSQMATLTVDTPANRALKALLRRFRARADSLATRTQALLLDDSAENQVLRRERRVEVLEGMVATSNELLKSHPFADVAKAELTAAGLTQISAHPIYSRAYRKGTEALRAGVEGMTQQDLLQVSPSWGVYETWCFIQTASVTEELLGQKLRLSRPSVAAADLALSATLATGAHLELLFQAISPSEFPSGGRRTWSLSAERRPDIVVVVTHGSKRSYVVLDAKYRSGRNNVLEAMTSAHIYHDALRVDGYTAAFCLLLLPGNSSVLSLENALFWEGHGVGTISEFASGGQGLPAVCSLALSTWLRTSFG